MGTRNDGITLVDDVGGSGAGTPVDITSPIGQQSMADSVSVVIASDQTPIPVTGPLTNAELRAAPVDVTGIVAVVGPITIVDPVEVTATDLDIRDLAFTTDKIDITGSSVAISNFPAIQPVSTKTDLTPSAPTVVSVGIASASAVAAAATRKGLILRNLSNARISLGKGGNAAVLDSGITLYPRDVFCMNEYDFDTGVINAIASLATSNLAIQEYLT